jgi:hypothetical protein
MTVREHRKQCRVLKPLSFQYLRGIERREIHRLFHISVKKSGKLSTVRITTVTPIRTRVIYNQPFNRPSSFTRQGEDRNHGW